MISQQPLILHVEPSLTCARLLELLISRIHNYQIIHTTSSEEAIKIAIKQQPNIILTEMQLPNMSGIELMSRIRAHELTRHIPVLGISANAIQDDIDRALEKGIDAYITKPFILKELYETIRAYSTLYRPSA